jgi:hypothetical protein
MYKECLLFSDGSTFECREERKKEKREGEIEE